MLDARPKTFVFLFAFSPLPLFSRSVVIYPVPHPNEHLPILINRYPLGIDQLGFEVSKVVIVNLKLALEGAV